MENDLGNETPPAVAEHIGKCSDICNRLSILEGLVGNLVKVDLDELLSSTTSIESAKACAAITFSLATLMFVGLNVRGADISNHSVMKDIERIRNLVKTIKDIESNSDDNQSSKRLRIDSQAARRILEHHIK